MLHERTKKRVFKSFYRGLGLFTGKRWGVRGGKGNFYYLVRRGKCRKGGKNARGNDEEGGRGFCGRIRE